MILTITTKLSKFVHVAAELGDRFVADWWIDMEGRGKQATSWDVIRAKVVGDMLDVIYNGFQPDTLEDIRGGIPELDGLRAFWVERGGK